MSIPQKALSPMAVTPSGMTAAGQPVINLFSLVRMMALQSLRES